MQGEPLGHIKATPGVGGMTAANWKMEGGTVLSSRGSVLGKGRDEELSYD